MPDSSQQIQSIARDFSYFREGGISRKYLTFIILDRLVIVLMYMRSVCYLLNEHTKYLLLYESFGYLDSDYWIDIRIVTEISAVFIVIFVWHIQQLTFHIVTEVNFTISYIYPLLNLSSGWGGGGRYVVFINLLRSLHKGTRTRLCLAFPHSLEEFRSEMVD